MSRTLSKYIIYIKKNTINKIYAKYVRNEGIKYQLFIKFIMLLCVIKILLFAFNYPNFPK